MKQFVLKYTNIDKDFDQLENVAPMGDTCISPKMQSMLIDAPYHEVFDSIKLKRDPLRGGVISPNPCELPSGDYNTILIRKTSGVILTHYNEEERSLLVYYRLEGEHDLRDFNRDLYTILAGYIGLPEDIRKGQLLYTNNEYWTITAYKRRLMDSDTGEALTLDGYRRLRIQDLSYLTSEDSHYKELREAVIHWLNHSTTGVLKRTIESGIITQQLILNIKS